MSGRYIDGSAQNLRKAGGARMLCGFPGSLGFGGKGRRGDAQSGRGLNACLVGMFNEKRFDGAHAILYASIGQPVINLSGDATTG